MNYGKVRVGLRRRWVFSFGVALWLIVLVVSVVHVRAGAPLQTTAFQAIVLRPSLPEAPFDLRFFGGTVKTNSRGEIITGFTSDPVKRLVGAEAAGPRAGVDRFTKIMFGVNYFDGRPDPDTRLDPNNQIVKSGNQHWPFVPQPFRSWPNALALTPDGAPPCCRMPCMRTTAARVRRRPATCGRVRPGRIAESGGYRDCR
jgi:hypothetical protein